MDSKLMRRVIVAVIAMITVVFAIVVLGETVAREKTNAEENASSQEEMSQEEQENADFRKWMQDGTFFDPEPKKFDVSKMGGKEVSLLVTSVEKDLRIRIVDLVGNPVSGQSFYVIVEELGEYKDLDQDGIIYIGGLSAGEYAVSLKDQEGYKVPTTKVSVTVKDKVEYTAIDDISLLIFTEADIDAKLEDTQVNEAKNEGDATEITIPKLTEENARFGIDVSKWNKEIDWNRVKEAGVSYAIIRCGYRGSSTGTMVEDPYFRQNIEGAIEAGVDVGVYFFTQAVNEVEAVEEASMVIALCRDYNLTYPVFIDTEGAGGNGRGDGLDKATRTLVCKAFCETIKKEKMTPGVYASKNWYNNNLHKNELSEYVIWLAEYRENVTYTGDYHMWQYTSKGNIDGISTRVDLNLSYLDVKSTAE